jgi:putative transposase
VPVARSSSASRAIRTATGFWARAQTYFAACGAGRENSNSRNGTRTKTVLTEIGPVQIEVPRDRDASFDPVIVRKRQRRLDGIDEIVLSLTARGLTTGEVAAHFDEVYEAKVSKDTISRITDKVLDEMTEWAQRPLDAVYPVLFIDAIHIKPESGHLDGSRERSMR